MPPDRYCVRCKRKLSVDKRKDADFCGATCRVAWNRAREQVRADSDLHKQLEQKLQQHALQPAHFYRLLLGDGSAVWAYPSVAHASRRFDKKRRRTPGFLLCPYEPPMVPRNDRYEEQLLDAQGQPLSTPSELIVVHVEPTRKPVGLTTGDRLQG